MSPFRAKKPSEPSEPPAVPSKPPAHKSAQVAHKSAAFFCSGLRRCGGALRGLAPAGGVARNEVRA
jgi:hypothetical protein